MKHRSILFISSFVAACGAGEAPPLEAQASAVVGASCAAAPDVGSQDDFVCTQVIGFSQTFNWYGANGRHFEAQDGIDPDRWQLLWHSGAGVENWADPSYEGYDPSVPGTRLVSPCAASSDRPDRVVLTISSNVLDDSSSAQDWADGIQAAVDTIRATYSPRRIVLQPVVGGTPAAPCATRASANHPVITQGIELATTNRRVRGPYPQVEDCSWFSDDKGHLLAAGQAPVAAAIATCYDF